MDREDAVKENELVVKSVLALFPADFKGVCIDVGAYHPTWLSNSYELEQNGWDVYCIEPNPYCIPDLLQERENVIQCAVGNVNFDWVDFYIYRAGHGPNDMAGHTGLIEKDQVDKAGNAEVVRVNVRMLDYLIAIHALPVDRIDFLTIDTEGTEMDVLRGFDIRAWAPKVIVIENIEQSTEQSDYLQARGYTLHERIVFNDIYERIN